MKKIKVALADVFNDVNETESGFGIEGDTPSELDAPYVPVKEAKEVSKTIEILNGLCKKYKYAVLRDHQVIEENSMAFYVDYTFNGKEVGVVSLELDKQTNGKWVCRCYLSVKRAAKLPLTNVTTFISDFKKLIDNLHISCTEKPIS